MRGFKMGSFSFRAVPVFAAVMIVIALLPGSSRAANLRDLQQLQGNIAKTVNRSGGLARAILKKIKEIDSSCRAADGRPLPGQREYARQILGRTRTLRGSFAAHVEEAEKSINEFGRTFKQIRTSGERAGEIRSAVDRLREDLHKYKKYVDKFVGRAERDFGPPIEPAKTTIAATGPPAPATAGLRIKGEVGGVLGGSSYKRPHADPVTDLTASDLSLRVAGAVTPSSKTRMPFHLSHQNKIEQKKIGLTKLGAGIDHTVNDRLGLGFDLQYSGYSDKDNKVLSFGDVSLGARSSFQTDQLKLKVNLRRISRSYGDNELANYSTLNLQPDLALRAGEGTATVGIKIFSKANEVETLDHRELSPFFRWEFAPGGSELNVRYQQISHPNVEDAPQDNNRLKARFVKKDVRASGKTTYGPEVAVYMYPNADQNDYLDLGFALNGQSLGRKTSMKSMRLVYRRYSDSLRFDFAQVTFRQSKRPLGSGFGWEINLAGRYYTESSEKDNPLRFSNVHDPHTVDYYHRMGWTITGSGTLREISFGPIFGGKFYLDTERDDAFENDVDYLWANPRNTALGGIHVRMRVLATPTLRVKTVLQWRTDFLYNAAPTRRYSTTDLDLAADYRVNPRLFVEVRARLHTTRADVESDTDLEKSNISAKVRYLFDIVQ